MKRLLLCVWLLAACAPVDVSMHPTETWHRTSREPLPPDYILDRWLASELSISVACVRPKSKIVDDLGADEFDAYIIPARLSVVYGVPITHEEFVSCPTVEQLQRLINSKL